MKSLAQQTFEETPSNRLETGVQPREFRPTFRYALVECKGFAPSVFAPFLRP